MGHEPLPSQSKRGEHHNGLAHLSLGSLNHPNQESSSLCCIYISPTFSAVATPKCVSQSKHLSAGRSTRIRKVIHGNTNLLTEQ